MNSKELKNLLKANHISAYRMAKDTGISVVTIYRWLHGLAEMSMLSEKVVTEYFKKL